MTARVRPGLVPALVVFAIYLVLVVGLTAVLSDAEYTEVTNSTASFRDGVVIPIGLASLFLAAVTSYFGWWKPALFEERTTPRWLAVWPVLAIVAFVASVAVDADQWDTGLSVLLLVGFTLVAGLTALQVASTYGSGTLFYFGRRIGGTLLVGMALHMLFDTALTVHGGPGAELNSDTSSPPVSALAFQLVGVVFLIIALRKKMLIRTNPGPYIEPLLANPSTR